MRISINPVPSVFPVGGTVPKLHWPVGTQIQEFVGVTIAGVITCRSKGLRESASGPGRGTGAGGDPLSVGKLNDRIPWFEITPRRRNKRGLPLIVFIVTVVISLNHNLVYCHNCTLKYNCNYSLHRNPFFTFTIPRDSHNDCQSDQIFFGIYSYSGEFWKNRCGVFIPLCTPRLAAKNLVI